MFLINALGQLLTLFFFKWANPGLFFVYFGLSKQTSLQPLQQTNVEKKFIQCTVPGFEPTTFGT